MVYLISIFILLCFILCFRKYIKYKIFLMIKIYEIIIYDFNNPVGALPRYDDKIIMKVTRLSWENKEQPKTSPESLFM